MKSKKFHTLRRITGAFLLLVLIGLPFLRINGQSAFRFDLPTLRLLFFGTEIWMADFFIVLIAVIFLTFFTLFVTTFFGRVWCGWLCPQTVLVDAANFFETAGKRGPALRMAAGSARILLSALVAASVIGYFVTPSDIPVLIREGGAAANIIIWSWTSLFVLLYLDLFWVKRSFCATVCPYAKLQGVLFDDRTLLAAFDKPRAQECMECEACVKACPVGIDIRKGIQTECIHCAECVDACTGRMAVRGRKSLVRYAFGLPGSVKTSLRPGLFITGVITVLSLLFFIYLAASRMPFDVHVRLNYTGKSQEQTYGGVTNIYEVSFRNLSSNDLVLELNGSAQNGTVYISPGAVTLQKGSDITRIPVAVTMKGVPRGRQTTEVILNVRSSHYDKSLSKKLYFKVMPKHD